MKKIFLFLFLIGWLTSCETELTDFEASNQTNAIVVYGEVNNLSGPYHVRLNTTTAYDPYDVSEYLGKPITNAQVKIVDGSGNIYDMAEVQAGYYEASPMFKGLVGQKYQLKITTSDGKAIESDLVELKAPAVFNKFDYTFVNAEKALDMKFNVTAEIQDPAATEDYYFIKRQDFIQFLTTCPEPPPPPAPVPICYSKCWRAPFNSQPVLLKDFLVNGRNIPIPIGSVDYKDYTDWIIQLDIYSVSKTIYNYWQRLEDQRNVGGGIFDKIPAQIVGNLTCTSDPRQEVLGAFVVGGVNKQRLSIDRFTNIPTDAYQKMVADIGIFDYRYSKLKLWDCQSAGWIEYNIGHNLPPLLQ
ncbi:DUF4249 domain-containing protein [Emticicia agri]|uniref:DUF4249 domain-containing protein n=1 Tax=Emticicia agri TaxID=2492393 RepID=A0A4Q5LZK6_9BACT|nr:DUF4249 domain-containing protein [Emticicia agri]RYU94987.1 DUF4249 domain-containing protein [Emticicia agri]